MQSVKRSNEHKQYFFSIIMVCYNSQDTIEQAICSVLNQTYNYYELIIIDGKSSDGTSQIICKYLNDKIIYVCEKDSGIYNAMNKGLALAKGEIISFLNSDDWYENNALYNINSFLNGEDCDIVVAQTNNIIDERKHFRYSECNANSETIHYKANFSHQGMFVKKKCFDAVGNFSEKYRIASDYDWIIKAHNRKVSFKTCDYIVANFRMNGVSITNPYERYCEYYEVALNNIGEHGGKMISTISNYYEPIINHYKIEKFFMDNWKDSLEDIVLLFSDVEKCYIWGTGYYGTFCYKMCESLGIRVVGFIDNSKLDDEVLALDVISPEKIEKNSYIIISSFKYEGEIRRQLQDMDYESKYIKSLSVVEQMYYYMCKDKSH